MSARGCRSTARTMRAVVASTVAALLVAGCGGGEPDGPRTPTAAPASAGDTTPSEGSGETGTPTPDETSTVPPASGARLELDLVAATAPEGWRKDDPVADVSVTAGYRGFNFLTLAEFTDPYAGQAGFRKVSQEVIVSSGWLQEPKLLPPTELDGVDVYHLSGRVSSAAFLEEFGALMDGKVVVVRLLLGDGQSAPERQRIVDAVLQTVELG